MAPDMVSNITQSSSLVSVTRLDSAATSAREETNQPASSPPSQVALQSAVATQGDKVSISEQSRQAAIQAGKLLQGVPENEKNRVSSEPQQDEQDEKNNSSGPKVQFLYDLKGELLVKYFDAAENLIYQVPSELLMNIREAESKTKASVNTRV